MKEYVEYIAKHLVDEPDKVSVKEVVSGSTIIYELKVAKQDIGKIIGKQGRTANAIRTLLTASAARNHDKRAILELIE